MINIISIPDYFKVHYAKGATADDAVVRFEGVNGRLRVYVTSTKSEPCFIELRWNIKIDGNVSLLGDCWERAYGDMCWHGITPEKFMPWYFFMRSGKTVNAFGVEVRPNCFASWSVDKSGISCWLDVRCGGTGVALGGRELSAATIVSKRYYDTPSFTACCDFCKEMSKDPLPVEKPVYGGNNWYYAYGNSSYNEIVGDARLQAKLAEGLENRPFMVIDDGWQLNGCSGPWEPNEKFMDMQALANNIKSLDVRPGIWVRYLSTQSPTVPESFKIHRKNGSKYLDPSHPKVLHYVARETRKFVSWGYELIKHDFSTFDIFGFWGSQLNGAITDDGWTFYDRSKTSAEIVKNFYRVIRESADDAIILGCNCISHLAAGYVHLNRIGDDTSGKEWNRTRKYGINALAFRLAQHKAFYDIDADCVGIIQGEIPWNFNSQWLDLLSRSGTPLFISCPEKGLTDSEFVQMKKAYKYASEQADELIPLDWEETSTPEKWLLNGIERNYEWYGEHGVNLEYLK